MKSIRQQRSANRKKRIQRRLAERHWEEQKKPMFGARNISYELAERDRGLACGGIGAMQLVARRTGLVEAIDRELHVLKRHLPYFESDHVLNIAFNHLSGGQCMQDLELRRNDEVYLDALGAQRIPDPTTEGDFCRRFEPGDIETLMDLINSARLWVWRQQPEEFLREAVLDADGTLAETTGECKEGMDIAYNGTWGYHPLVISLANTQEPLFLINRSASRPSQEGAAEWLDRAIALCRKAGFRRIRLRGDTDFSQTQHLDRWHRQGVAFVFGIDASSALVERAEMLANSAWTRLVRPPKHEVRTEPRQRPANVKQRIVAERGFEKIRTDAESVASFPYRPRACKRDYRIVVLRKNLTVSQGETALFDDLRYFFFITNDAKASEAALVLEANGRCNQENLIAQLKGGVQAMQMPVDALHSNWAYMIMASLAWTLKAWFALLLPTTGRWAERHGQEKARVLKMEFRTFLQAFMLLPAQIVQTGRRIVYRLLSWNPWQHVFLRGLDALHYPLRT